jgi:hypothetical protein
MSLVADLLARSRAAHLDYRRHAGSCDKHGNITQTYHEQHCVTAIQKALNTRLEAHRLDPQHTDPAWQLDTAEHDQLTAFYTRFLER